ncbi:Zinc transporter [Coemansia biformis]|uniref:Zinc transporter n=1 Tax=Coemansia biformis TaxID=1286918 RepID=A0A9W7YDG0_9FUNG|nr:Zinc transporter [Coemansia biformis]
MASSTSQAWLFAMTSGLASALGGATLYVDPLLHLFGAPRSFNVLDSHTVLCVVLATASGAMAYTSMSVLTRESIDYLSDYGAWPAVKRHPGATTAVLFVVGAYLNLLLARVIELVSPADSPIKHACASHPPSPSRSHGDEELSAGWPGSRTDSSQETPAGPPGEPLDGPRRHGICDERLPLLLRDGPAVTPPGQPIASCPSSARARDYLPVPGVARDICKCEYACTSPRCYSLEHCHITPLFPHMHAHGSGHALPAAGSSSGGQDTSRGVHTAHGIHGAACVPGLPPPGVPGLPPPAAPSSGNVAQISRHHKRQLMHVGLQTAVAIGLHKVPEGLIIYLSRQASPRLGLSVAASLFFHNLPEGLMLALPLFLATGRRHTAFAVAALLGAMPPAIGAALGMLVVGDAGRPSAQLPGVFGIAFGVIAGMLCMVALNGMLPTARIYDRSGNTVAWCFALGAAAMLFANTTLE